MINKAFVHLSKNLHAKGLKPSKIATSSDGDINAYFFGDDGFIEFSCGEETIVVLRQTDFVIENALRVTSPIEVIASLDGPEYHGLDMAILAILTMKQTEKWK